jgi:hypothetical protein
MLFINVALVSIFIPLFNPATLPVRRISPRLA